MKNLRENPSAWVLEIGASAIRLCSVQGGPTQRQLAHCQQAARAERWQPRPELPAAVPDLHPPARPQPLVICVPDELVLFRPLTLPAVAAAALAKIVQAQLEVIMPSRDGLFVSGWSSQPHPSGPGQSLVWVCAVRRDTLDRSISYAASLEAQQAPVVLPSAMALAAGYVAQHGQEKESAVLVDVGGRSTSVLMLCGGRLVNVAVLDEGGDHWTEAIAQALGISPEQAEPIKLALSAGEAGARDTAAGDARDTAVAGWANQLREVYLSLLESAPSAGRPVKCVLTGRASATPGLAEAVAERLGLKVELAKPPAGLSLPEGMDAGSALTAVGAVEALEPGSSVCTLNGIGAAGTGRRPFRRRHVVIAAAWLVGALLLLWGLDVREAHWLERSIASLRSSMGQESQIDAQLAMARYLESPVPAPLAVLEKLSSLAGPQTVLSNWRYARSGEMGLAGTVPTQEELHGFMKRLTECGMFSEVTLQSLKGEAGKVRFEMLLKSGPARGPSTTQPATQPVTQAATQAGASPTTGPTSRPGMAASPALTRSPQSASEPAALAGPSPSSVQPQLPTMRQEAGP